MFVGFCDPTIPTSASWWLYICSCPSCKHRTRNQCRKFSWCHLLLGYEDCIFRFLSTGSSSSFKNTWKKNNPFYQTLANSEFCCKFLSENEKWTTDGSSKLANQTVDAIDLLPVHYHSHHKRKLGWATGNFELIHYTNMAGKSLMFNRKIASSFVHLYSLSVYVSLPAIGKTGAFPPVLPNRCCLTHRWATPTEVVAQAIVEWWVEAVALEKTLGK